jgi:hypothetical protein
MTPEQRQIIASYVELGYKLEDSVNIHGRFGVYYGRIRLGGKPTLEEAIELMKSHHEGLLQANG